MATPPKILQIVETVLYVEDLARSREFYEEVVGLRCLAQGNRGAFFAAPKNMLLLFRAVETLKPSDVPTHGASGIQHIAFEIEASDYDAWKAWLTGHGVVILQEMTWQDDLVSGRSLYFHDPDGHVLELITRGSWTALQ